MPELRKFHALAHAIGQSDTIAGEFCSVLALQPIFGDIVQCCDNRLVTTFEQSIQQSGGSFGIYASPTMSNAIAGTNSQYPRFRFGLLTVGQSYTAAGKFSGDLASVVKLRLANAGSANDLTFNPTTGEISGTVLAASNNVEILTDGTSAFSITIDSFVLCQN